MNKKITILFGAVSLILAAWIYSIVNQGTPNEFSEEAWPDTKEKAIHTTVEYFKNERNIDVKIDQVSSSGEYATHEVYLDGHVVGNEKKKVSAVVDTSEKNYRVTTVNTNS